MEPATFQLPDNLPDLPELQLNYNKGQRVKVPLYFSVFTDLQPLREEVLVQQGHEAGEGQHALPVHHPVERVHLLLVWVDDQVPETQRWRGTCIEVTHRAP